MAPKNDEKLGDSFPLVVDANGVCSRVRAVLADDKAHCSGANGVAPGTADL